MHNLIIFTRRRLQGNVKKRLLKVEYMECIQKLIVKYVEHFSDKVM